MSNGLLRCNNGLEQFGSLTFFGKLPSGDNFGPPVCSLFIFISLHCITDFYMYVCIPRMRCIFDTVTANHQTYQCQDSELLKPPPPGPQDYHPHKATWLSLWSRTTSKVTWPYDYSPAPRTMILNTYLTSDTTVNLFNTESGLLWIVVFPFTKWMCKQYWLSMAISVTKTTW